MPCLALLGLLCSTLFCSGLRSPPWQRIATHSTPLLLRSIQPPASPRDPAPSPSHSSPPHRRLADISGFTALTEKLSRGDAMLPSGAMDGERRSLSHYVAYHGSISNATNEITNAQKVAQVIRRSSLGRLKTEGNENVRRIVYSFFESLCQVIDEEDGDVLRLAGDAIIVSFGGGEKERERERERETRGERGGEEERRGVGALSLQKQTSTN